MADLKQRNKLLEMVRETSEILLASDLFDLENSLLKAMDMMARCVDADRMYIWKNQIVNGKRRYEPQYEWLGERVKNTSTPCPLRTQKW